MTSSDPTAIVITTIFAVLGIYCAVRVVIGYSLVDRASNAIHLLMGVAMLAMPWAWYSAIPAWAQIVFFTAAGLWYAYLALFDPHADAGPGESHHRGPALIWYHAAMMASMAWMAVAMTPPAPADSMPGMDMPGMAMPGMSMGAGAAPMTGSAPWATPVSWTLTAFFVLAACWFVVRLIRQAVLAEHLTGRTLVTVLDSLISAAMAAGMALAFWTLTV